MKTRKIALILAGGASLGSYEAGVLTELLYALEELNARSDDQRFVVDVITGSSAGALTGVLVARMMLYDLPGRRRDLFNAWVKEINIERLLDSGNAPPNALLSKKVINTIARKYILDGANQPARSPASFAPDELRLSLTLSNMHGLDYGIPYTTPQAGSFISTVYSDMARFALKRGGLPDQATWKVIVDAAIASGNFPLAFQPQHVCRDIDSTPEYRESLQAKAETEAFFPRDLAFLDGGIFDNEPLREAITQAADLDGGTCDPTRIFILVDPNINRSTHTPDISPDDSIECHVKQLIKMVRGESVARDWMRAQRTNNELAWRNDMLVILADMVRTCPEDVQSALMTELDKLIDSIMQTKHAVRPNRYSAEYPEEVMRQLPDQPACRPAYDRLAADGATNGTASDAFLDRLIFALNAVAGLQHKATLNLALIGSQPEETAGDQLWSFGGFFDEQWREHDFRRGRIKAHTVLPEILRVAPYCRENAQGDPSDDYTIPDAWQHFPHVTIRDADRGMREQLYAVLLQRIDEVLQRASVPWVVRRLAKQFYVKGQLRTLLALQQTKRRAHTRSPTVLLPTAPR